MNRSFLVPATIACSAHALLMFGFNEPHRPHPPVPVEKPTCCPEDPPRKPVEVTIATPEKPSESDARDNVDVAPLRSPIAPPAVPETPPIATTARDFLMDPVKVDSSTTTTTMKFIPTGPVYPSDERGVIGAPNSGGPIVYPASGLDAAPRARLQAPPAYPYALKVAGVSGEVVVEFVVDESGRVLNPRVVRSTHVEFEAPSLAAVASWRFEPGTRKTFPVKFMMRVPLTFNLD
jgi:periplasmic protein TonB